MIGIAVVRVGEKSFRVIGKNVMVNEVLTFKQTVRLLQHLGVTLDEIITGFDQLLQSNDDILEFGHQNKFTITRKADGEAKYAVGTFH